MVKKIKYSRKDLKAPDEFISAFTRITGWAKENRGVVIGAALAVIVASGAVFGTLTYLQWKERAAGRALWPQIARVQALLQAPTKAEKGDLAPLEASLARDVERHRGTRAAVFGEYYLGDIAYRLGNYAASATWFRKALHDRYKEGTILDYLLRVGLAQALESQGKEEKAEKAYQEAAAAATGELRIEAQMGRARTLAASGHKKQAEQVLRGILAENPDTPEDVKALIEVELAQMG
jgi:tetratricopeptide (TPR) repeat protein